MIPRRLGRKIFYAPRLWKTKYPLVVRKIGEYAAGLRTMRGREIPCLIEMPRRRVQPGLIDLRGRVNTCT
jgi:hypothetical protein